MQGPTATADQIAELLRRKADALVQRSAPMLLQLLQQGFVYVTASGQRLDRAGYIEASTGPRGLRFHSQEFEQLEVSDFGDFAIATMILHDRFEIEGRTVSPTFRTFCVFRKHGSTWLWVGGQTCAADKA